MATISDLVEKHSKVPGDIVVSRYGMGSNLIFFRPYFIDASLLWHGLSPNQLPINERESRYEDWQFGEEPKPKVKRAQYLCVPEDDIPFVTNKLCKDEADVRALYPYVKSFTRLLETEREFER